MNASRFGQLAMFKPMLIGQFYRILPSVKLQVLISDLFGLEPIWRVWLEPICIGCGSGDLIGGVEWILRLWSSWSASRISN